MASDVDHDQHLKPQCHDQHLRPQCHNSSLTDHGSVAYNWIYLFIDESVFREVV